MHLNPAPPLGAESCCWPLGKVILCLKLAGLPRHKWTSDSVQCQSLTLATGLAKEISTMKVSRQPYNCCGRGPWLAVREREVLWRLAADNAPPPHVTPRPKAAEKGEEGWGSVLS